METQGETADTSDKTYRLLLFNEIKELFDQREEVTFDINVTVETKKPIKEEDIERKVLDQNKFNSKMMDYELKLNKKEKKIEIKTYNDQKQLLLVKNRIQVYMNYVRTKRSIINKNLKEKKINEYNQISNIYIDNFEKLQINQNKRWVKLMLEKNQGKSKKDSDLKSKKIKKQLNKKTKNNVNFFMVNNCGKSSNSKVKDNYSELVEIDNWKVLLHKQLNSILDKKKYPVDILLSTLSFQIENYLNNIISGTTLPLKIMLKTFDDQEYTSNKSYKPDNQDSSNNKVTKENNEQKFDDLINEIDGLLAIKSHDIKDKKSNFSNLIINLNEEENKIKQYAENKNKNLEEIIKDTISHHTEQSKKKEEKTPDNDKFYMDRLKIKQRLVKFNFKNFDKFDIKKIMEFWINNRKELKKFTNKDKAKKNDEYEDEKNKKNSKDEKKNEKTDSNIKYEFKKPEKDIRKIIPNCNNLFYIIKNEN